ncbi:MAG TPA: sigma 54-interacting transcriptional regulator [Polyangiaceae bacterium]|jgi:DNA-binding NtrC family response regulator
MSGSTVATTKAIQLRGGTIHLAARPEKRVVIGGDPVLVGRDGSCTLVIDDKRVSAVHGELVATARGVRVRDLGSKNGIWSADVNLQEGYLTEATTLMFGPAEILFEPARPERLRLFEHENLGGLYGRTPAMREVFARIERSAPSDLTVLVEGETGTGKELVAKAIHDRSPRGERPFVVVDCGSIPHGLAESTLFGHVRGAFTGATDNRTSPFVLAEGGTVFLDELGELPLDTQPKLLRALAERRVQAVGASGYAPFDARIVAATRRDLSRAVNEDAFRSDLYFRIAQMRITMPSLRERVEDIPGLVQFVLDRTGHKNAFRRIPRDSMAQLLRHDWPGNVRELCNVVAVAVALADEGAPIDLAAHLGALTPAGRARGGEASTELPYHEAKRAALDHFEKNYFAALAEKTGGNIAEISRRAKLQRTHVRRYLVTHGIKKR